MSAAAGRYAGRNQTGNIYGNTKNLKNTGIPGNLKSSKKFKTKMKIRKAGARIKTFLFAVLMIMTVATVFLFLTNKYIFKIKTVSITANEKYSYDEILKASGIVEGQELYGIDVKQIKFNIKEMLTYAESVSVTQIPPSTVNIDIKTEKGLFGIMLGGDYYILSRSFRVIDKINVVGNTNAEKDFIPPDGIITFETDTVKKCYTGEKIEFTDSDIFDCLKDIAKLADENGEMLSAINSIDVTNKFKVVMNYGDRFLIKFGLFENISSKIINSFEIINSLPDYAEGIIDMNDSKVASFRYDENVTKLYKSGKNK